MIASFDLDEMEPWPGDDPLDRAYASGIVHEDQRWVSDFTYRPIPLPDSLTILKGLGGRVLAKQVHGAGKIADYDRAARFNMTRHHVGDLDDVEVLLRWLARQPDRCIVRGNIASGKNVEYDVPRLLHPREGQPATIADVRRRWVAIDVDDFPDEATLQRAEHRIGKLAEVEHQLPRSIEPNDLIGAAWVATSVLPPQFYAAECLVQATASHGLRSGLRIRMWFWLDRPVSTAELKYWFRDAPVDPSVFNAAQIVYTAAPLFADGVIDPVPDRLVRVIGGATVIVPPAPELRPKPRPKPIQRLIAREGVSPEGEIALDKAEAAILAARRGAQEPTLVKQSYRIACAVAAGNLPERLAHDALLDIGRRLPDLDPAWPWTAHAVKDKIDRAFAAGLQGGRHA